MHVVEDLGSPADDRAANEGMADVDQDGTPLNPGATPSQSRLSRRTPSQILGGTPATVNIIPELDADTTPKSHYDRSTFSNNDVFYKGGGSIDPTVIEEIPNMILLIVLYMLQGVPLGLTFGTIPMLLASKASYTQVCTTAAAQRSQSTCHLLACSPLASAVTCLFGFADRLIFDGSIPILIQAVVVPDSGLLLLIILWQEEVVAGATPADFCCGHGCFCALCGGTHRSCKRSRCFRPLLYIGTVSCDTGKLEPRPDMLCSWRLVYAAYASMGAWCPVGG